MCWIQAGAVTLWRGEGAAVPLIIAACVVERGAALDAGRPIVSPRTSWLERCESLDVYYRSDIVVHGSAAFFLPAFQKSGGKVMSPVLYKVTSLVRKRPPLGPFRRPRGVLGGVGTFIWAR